MEILSTEFLSALLAIVVIDLVLAGDNAIVIALAARNLPQDLRKKAIIWGNHSATQFPDFVNAKIDGKPATEVIGDRPAFFSSRIRSKISTL